jgi:hypothetical protein
MRQDTFILLTVLFFAFMAIPFVPHESFIALDNTVVRFILLAILMYSVYYGPLVAVAAFMLIAALLLERNHRIMSFSKLLYRFVPRNLFTRSEVEDEEMEMPQSEEIRYVDQETPEHGESEFVPKDYSGQNDFEPLNLPENHKDVRAAVPLGEAAASVFPSLD